MVTHMTVLGSTLISSMYVIRTLNNDKLDSEKRKTLAINDGLTWAVSTVGAYLLDAKLANWWEDVTRRFVANYLKNNPNEKNTTELGDWDVTKLNEMLRKNNCKNVRDFNLDFIKNPKLTTYIDGMGVLKTVFVFGMVYRYIVPTLIMKPANKLGAYINAKKAEKQNNQNPKM